MKTAITAKILVLSVAMLLSGVAQATIISLGQVDLTGNVTSNHHYNLIILRRFRLELLESSPMIWSIDGFTIVWRAAAHGMAVANELLVEDPLEAMFVGLLAVGERALPAAPNEERHWREIDARLRGHGRQRRTQGDGGQQREKGDHGRMMSD